MITLPTDADNKNSPAPPNQNGSGPSNSGVQLLPPPSYQASQAPVVQQEYVPVQWYRQSPFHRFLKAFLVACLIWFLLGMLLRSFIDLVYWGRGHRHGRWLDYSEYPIPTDVSLGTCVSKTGWRYHDGAVNQLSPRSYPYSSRTTFDIPLSSNTLSLISRGPWSSGSVDIVTSPDQDKTKVTYHVTVHYVKEEVRDIVEVCSISRWKGVGRGVGIFTPRWPHFPFPSKSYEDTVYIETKVVFPESSKGAVTAIKNFVTDVPNTVQRIGDLNSKVNFESITLLGSNSAIIASSLAAVKGKLTTTNGHIGGVFNVSDKLQMRTSNSAIIVQVGLINKKDGPEPQLSMETTNGAIEGDFSLLPSSTKATGGVYHIKAVTSNSHLGLDFSTAPVGSILDLDATTSNGEAQVNLHPTFEGVFALETSSIFKPTFIIKDESNDPAGKGRKRDWNYISTERGQAHGEVWWGVRKKTKGSVRVETSNSNIVLKL